MNPFEWLRRLARAAVLNGVQDALSDVTPDGHVPPVSLEELQERLAAATRTQTLALPEAEEPQAEATTTKRKKG
jgi:hypothetical protein